MPLDEPQLDRLRDLLDGWLERFDPIAWRAHDPVSVVWRYHHPLDREVAALISSSLAYGRASLVIRAARVALDPLGPAPAAALQELNDDELAALYEPFVYRMTRGPDLVDLLVAIRALHASHGSLEAAYLDAEADDPIARASAFVQRLRSHRLREALARGLQYLVSDPRDGSASKRLHLFLRWMVRGPDEVDLGCWSQVSAADLRMPLDTHTARITRYLGLLSRAATDAQAVEQVTQALRLLDPHDPVRYDFALCHLGISGGCVHAYSEDHCPQCPIASACVIAASR
jgi:uncharacterized protein (TIGR02757 family)